MAKTTAAAGALRTDAQIREDFLPGTHLCAGQPWLTIAQRESAMHLREELYAAGDSAVMRRRLEGLNLAIGRLAQVDRGYYALPGADAPLAELYDAWLRAANGRRPCLRDLAELKLAFPFDGRAHKVTCPACGNVTEFVPPLSVEQAARLDMVAQGEIEAALAR